MRYAVLELILTVIDLYWWVVIASFVISWLIAFDVINTRSQAALTEPLYEPIRRVLPTMGGLDFSPMIVLLGLQFVRSAIAHSFG
jgi:YggT family protein